MRVRLTLLLRHAARFRRTAGAPVAFRGKQYVRGPDQSLSGGSRVGYIHSVEHRVRRVSTGMSGRGGAGPVVIGRDVRRARSGTPRRATRYVPWEEALCRQDCSYWQSA